MLHNYAGIPRGPGVTQCHPYPSPSLTRAPGVTLKLTLALFVVVPQTQDCADIDPLTMELT